MATIKQKIAIRKTLETIGKKKPVKVGQIMLASGYSPAMAKNPQILTNSKAWQEAMTGIDWIKQLKQVEQLGDININSNLDNALKAKDMLFKLGDKYPQKSSVAINLFQKIDSLE